MTHININNVYLCVRQAYAVSNTSVISTEWRHVFIIIDYLCIFSIYLLIRIQGVTRLWVTEGMTLNIIVIIGYYSSRRTTVSNTAFKDVLKVACFIWEWNWPNLKKHPAIIIIFYLLLITGIQLTRIRTLFACVCEWRLMGIKISLTGEWQSLK